MLPMREDATTHSQPHPQQTIAAEQRPVWWCTTWSRRKDEMIVMIDPATNVFHSKDCRHEFVETIAAAGRLLPMHT